MRVTSPPHSEPPRAPRPHPNRLLFEGFLTVVDALSDKPPGGSRGKLVYLSTAAAEEALFTLEGMGVDYKEGWDGHNRRQKCGVIHRAELREGKVWICGHLFDSDYPEVARAIRELDMGMSYDVLDVHIKDMLAETWTITRLTFCGASILLRLKAAYSSSKIWIPE